MLDWKKHFDVIYAVIEVHRSDRMKYMMDELERVGISSSGILSVLYTSNQEVFNRMIKDKGGYGCNTGPIDHCLALHRAFETSVAKGHNRILVLEDDAAFLNDVSLVERIVNGMPESDIVCMDWTLQKPRPIEGGDPEALSRLRSIIDGISEDGFFDGDKVWDIGSSLNSGCCMALSRKAFTACRDNFNSGWLNPFDSFYRSRDLMSKYGLSLSFSKTPVALQRNFYNSDKDNSDPSAGWYKWRFEEGQHPDRYCLSHSGVTLPSKLGEMWRSKFDAVYLLHEASASERLDNIMSEMRRVGLEDSGILRVEWTFKSKYDKALHNGAKMSVAAANEAYSFLRILSEASALGYSRILFLEDDAAFLNDLSLLKRIVDATPDTDMVLYDWQTHIGKGETERFERLAELKRSSPYGDLFFERDLDLCSMWRNTAFALSAKAVSAIKSRLEDSLIMIDWFQNSKEFMSSNGLSCCLATTPICTQRVYRLDEGKSSLKESGMYMWSRTCGINPEDYNTGVDWKEDREMDLPGLWRSKFDAIYLFSCLDYVERYKNIMSELKRVGIYDSGVLNVERTAPLKIYLNAIRKGLGLKEMRSGLVDYNMAVYRALRKSLNEGHSRILLIEDDAVFLKDLGMVEKIVSSMPDSDIVKFDWVFDGASGPQPNKLNGIEFLMSKSSDGLFFSPDIDYHGVLWNSTVLALSDKGAKHLAAFFETVDPESYIDDSVRHLLRPGYREARGLTASVSYTPLAIQGDYSAHQSPLSTSMEIRQNCGQDIGLYNMDILSGSRIGFNKPSAETSTHPIDWSKWFDGIYLVHYIDQDDRWEFLKRQFKEIGIDDKILHVRYAYPNRFSEMVTEKVKSEHGVGWNTLSGWTDAAMNNLGLMYEARHAKSKRILLIENDVAFLKDLQFLEKAFDAIPEDADLCQLEYFRIDNQDEALECVDINKQNDYWARGLYPQRGGACTILSENGIDEFIRYWGMDPVPTDFAYRQLNCVKYHSKIRLAVQRPFDSGAIAATNALDGLTDEEISWYRLGFQDAGTPKRMCKKCDTDCGSDIVLPTFPVSIENVKDAMKSLSELSSKYHDYREPSCLMARLIYEASSDSNPMLIKMLLTQGLRVKTKKQGFPEDPWCWDGSPERLLAEMSDQVGAPGSENYLVI